MVDGLFLVQNRKWVTSFNGKPIDPDILSEILNCGRITPTQKHPQDWKFVVIKEKDTINKIAQLIDADWVERANVVVALFGKKNKFSAEYLSQAAEAMQLSAAHYNVGAYYHITHNEPCEKKISTLLNAPPQYGLMSVLALGHYNYAISSFSTFPSLTELVVNEKFK